MAIVTIEGFVQLFFRRSLSNRIAGAMAALLMVVTAVVTICTYIYVRRDAFQEKHALVDAMTYSLETTLADVPRATMQRVVENYGTIAGVRKIAIVDRHGRYVASTDRIDIDTQSTSPFIVEFLQKDTLTRTTHVTEHAFVILEPLRGRGAAGTSHRDIVGIAEVTLRIDAIEAIAEERARTLLAVSMGGYVILCLALWLMLRTWVTRPISTLALDANALRDGQRHRKRLIGGHDEVGRLAESFATMADRIDEMVRDLEHEVASRTADLQAERRALQREKELLELLFHVTAIANEAKSAESALSDALVKICKLAEFPSAIVFEVIKSDPPHLEPTNIRHNDDPTSWPASLPIQTIGWGQGVAGRVLETAVPIVEPPIAAFPLLVGTDVVGVMQFYMGRVSQDEKRLLEAMGTVGTELGRVVERSEVERMKDDFVSTVSHELRTPLTAIRGSLGLLAHGVLGELPAEALEVVTIANESCIRLVRLINDLLDMQKLAAGRIEIHTEAVPITSVLSTVIAQNEALARSSNVRLVLENSDLTIVVSADRDRLTQIATNLVSNAIKFSPPNTEVTLRTTGTAERVLVEVCDQGAGIPDDFKARIFERFAQNDASTTRRNDGTGLGLNISKRLVELHGGTIGFRDREGGGTIFYFEIPRVKSSSNS